MPAQLTTRQQVNGYRFLLRRLEHALMRRDVRMLHDPMRSHFRAVIAGVAISVVLTGGFFVYGLIKPAGSVGDSKIIVGKDSGAMYVMIDDTLHPVLNLASARLIIASPDKPESVSDSNLSGYKRGPLVGIPGAPQSLPGSQHPDHSYWTVCDTVLVPIGSGSLSGGVRTTVIGAQSENTAAAQELSDREALLARSGDTTYLLNDGKRFVVDADDPAVVRAFGIDGATVRPISGGMLNAFPDGDELTTPTISNRGKPSMTGLGPVGSIIEVVGVGEGSSTLYVVLDDGIQRVGQAAADVIRYSDRARGGQVETVAPAAITKADQLHDLPVDDFPAVAPEIIDQKAAPVGCLAWDRSSADTAIATLRVLAGTGLPLADGQEPVDLATSDGSGPSVDAAYIPPSTGNYVATTGSDPESPRRESLIYVNDAGVRFEVADADTGKALGLGDEPQVSPWPIVGLLPTGPRLSQHDALVERDSVALGGTGSDVEASGAGG